MDCQLRIRVDESFSRIEYIKDWLDVAPRGFAFEHNKPGNRHYHLYLFGIERDVDAMRKRLAKHLPKEHYAVGKTCGGKLKLKISFAGAWQYGTTKDAHTPIWHKGFTVEEMESYAKTASNYYRPHPIVARPEDANLPEVIIRADRVWERLFAHKEEYGNLTIKAIKSKLAVDWLNQGRAVPRSADLHRYSISLYYLNKFRDHPYIPDNALMEEYE